MSTAHPSATPSKLSSSRDWKVVAVCVVLAAAICFAAWPLLAPHWTRVMAWGLLDNDDAMRVLQVRDWLGGQAWFDVSQHRLNPPSGGDMHWSRIADLPLAALMAPLTAMFGSDTGMKYAAFWTPLVLGAIYLFVSVGAAVSLGGSYATLPGIILVACASAALSYFTPGRVDHHGLQMILIISALWGLFTSNTRGSVFAGLAIATGICVGLEALPLQVVLIGWVALRWGLRGDEVKHQTIGFGLGFGIAIALLFALTIPTTQWALPVNDAVGRGYVILGCVGGLLLAAGALKLGRFNISGRIGVLCAIALIILIGVQFFPEILVAPYEKVDPLLLRLWLMNVNEAKPLLTSQRSDFLAFAIFPSIAGVSALVAIGLAPKQERDIWSLAALTIIVATALAIFWQNRVAGLAAALSSIIAAAALARAFERYRWKVAFGLALVVNPILPSLAGGAIARAFEPTTTRYITGGGQGCFTQSSFKSLQNMPSGLVIAPIDMGARILLTTTHKVMAAPYHRNNVGNLAAYETFLASASEARTRAAALGATHIALCKRSAEVAILSRESPKGLMADLQAGRVPEWLTPLPPTKGSDVQAFTINTAINQR